MSRDASVIPFDSNAEQAFLGGIMRDNARMERLAEVIPAEALLTGEFLHDERHRAIFDGMRRLHEAKSAIDPVTLLAQLRDAGSLGQSGGASTLSDLVSGSNRISFDDCVKILIDVWLKRFVARDAADLARAAQNGASAADLQASIARLGRLVEQARPVSRSRASSLADFLAMDRPALEYLVDPGILPQRGKMTISAPAKAHKTFLSEELGFCLASGECEWLGMRFGPPITVLTFQPELSDALYAARTRYILKTLPDFLNRERILRNFIYAETQTGRPNFVTPEGRASAERLIHKHHPAVLICDPLYMLFPGLVENDAHEMTLALDYLAGLTIRFDVAVILIHHFGKSGAGARGSSVFQGWGETDLAISPLEDDKTVCKVEGLFRCSFGKGFPAYWQRPTEGNAWFEPMPEGWKPEKGAGRKASYSPAMVQMALKAAGRDLKWHELKEAVIGGTGCSERKAEILISEASEKGLILKAAGFYAPCNPPSKGEVK